MAKKSKKQKQKTANKEPEHGSITTIKKPAWHKLKSLIVSNKDAINWTDREKEPQCLTIDVSENGLDINVKPSSMRSRIYAFCSEIYGKQYGKAHIKRIRGKHGEPHIKFKLWHEPKLAETDSENA